jgi:hypothetical protein
VLVDTAGVGAALVGPPPRTRLHNPALSLGIASCLSALFYPAVIAAQASSTKVDSVGTSRVFIAFCT